MTVDTHGIESNAYLEKVQLDITFRVGETDKKTSYDFTGDDLRSLGSKQVYRRYLHLPLGIGSPVEIVAGKFDYEKVLSGGKADEYGSDARTARTHEGKPVLRSNPPNTKKVVGPMPPATTN